jgi:hypothetical protein
MNNLQVLGAHVVHRCGQFMGLISLVAKSDWWRASETRRPVIDTWLHGCSGTALKATPLYSNSGITVNVRYSSQGFAFLPANIARSLWQVQPNAIHPKDTGSIHARTGTTDYERPSKTPAKKHIVPRTSSSLSYAFLAACLRRPSARAHHLDFRSTRYLIEAWFSTLFVNARGIDGNACLLFVGGRSSRCRNHRGC